MRSFDARYFGLLNPRCSTKRLAGGGVGYESYRRGDFTVWMFSPTVTICVPPYPRNSVAVALLRSA
jgi:hypothetical protein